MGSYGLDWRLMESMRSEGQGRRPETTSSSTVDIPPGPRFKGNYPVKLEASGRVLLPAAFKAAFQDRAVLRPFHSDYLALWNPEGYEIAFAAFKRSEPGTVLGPRAKRTWAIGSTDVAVDKQSRLVIPPELRAKAGLGSEIVLAGSLERIEIWSAALFDEKVKPFLPESDVFIESYEGE